MHSIHSTNIASWHSINVFATFHPEVLETFHTQIPNSAKIKVLNSFLLLLVLLLTFAFILMCPVIFYTSVFVFFCLSGELLLVITFNYPWLIFPYFLFQLSVCLFCVCSSSWSPFCILYWFLGFSMLDLTSQLPSVICLDLPVSCLPPVRLLKFTFCWFHFLLSYVMNLCPFNTSPYQPWPSDYCLEQSPTAIM